MLRDIDLKYRQGVLATTKPVQMDSTLAVTGNTTVGGSVTVTGSVTAGGVQLGDPNLWLPADHGLLSWAYDPSFASSTTVSANGTLYLSALRIRRATTISKVWWMHGTAGASPVAGQNFAALISSAGTILSSVGIDAIVTNQNAAQNATLAAAQAVSPGFVWVALLFNAATPPTLLRTNGAFTGTNNANLSAALTRYAINGTGLTALPGSITPGSNGVGPSLWVGAS